MTKTWKTVRVAGYEFDALDDKVIVTADGKGRSLRVATHRAVNAMFNDSRLRRKHIGSFKLSVVVIKEDPR
jgi:hypothetical protein